MEGLSDIVTGGYGRTRALARANSEQGVDAVARQFEAYFLGQMLKSMRDASMGDPLFGSNSSQMYQDLFDDQMTLALAGGRGIGLAKVLRSQLADLPGVNIESKAEQSPEAKTRTPSMFPADRVSVAPEPLASADTTSARQAASEDGRMHGARNDIDGVFPPTAPVPPSTVPLAAARAISDAHHPVPVATAEALAERRSARIDALEQTPVAAKKRLNPLQHRSAHFASPEAFVSALMPHAQRAAAELGVPPQVLIAQSALETGWGKHVMPGANARSSSHNLFGIKADGRWGGDKVVKRTMEFDGAIMKRIDAPFRAYGSIGESFEDYVKFIKGNARYEPALTTSGDGKQYINALQRAGYATDPNYAEKVISLMQRGPIRAVYTSDSTQGAIPVTIPVTIPVPSTPVTIPRAGASI